MGEIVALAAKEFRPPQPLSTGHDFSGFDCGETPLNDWLKRHSLKNQVSGASKSFVVTRGEVVVGYYCLSVGSVARTEGIKELRRNMPDPVPVVVLGRLAVHLPCAGMGIGSGLLKDAALRTLQVAEVAGVAALLVHAKHEKAAQFYLKHGFRMSPVRDLTLMLPIREMAALAR